jgi:hypothetical protein
MRRLVVAAVCVALAGCGGGDTASVEEEEFIVELEVPLSQDLDEPDVYGQAGLSPNGRNGTRIVIQLDEPFKSPMQAFVRRGGCGGFRGATAQPDFELPDVKGGKVEAEVDAPVRELRMGYAIVVREPISEKELEEALRDRTRRFSGFEKGVCGDLSSADRVDDL